MKKLFSCISIILIVIPVITQQHKNLPFVKEPLSPNVASFNLYNEIPVSKYTGVPDISIPIYTIEINNFKMPVNLSYHPGGVKVESEASWVGLGWNLNVGGCISREIKGLDDFMFGYDNNLLCAGHFARFNLPGVPMSHKILLPNRYQSYDDFFGFVKREDIDCPGYLDFVEKRKMIIDTEPDVFTYNFLGYSGKFVIKENSNKAILEKTEDNLKIIFEYIDENTQSIQITVILPSGVKLFFNNYEEKANFSNAEFITQDHAIHGNKYISAWLLSNIELLDKSQIMFNYSTKYNIQSNVFPNQTRITSNTGTSEDVYPLVFIDKDFHYREVPSSSCGGSMILPECAPFLSETNTYGSFSYNQLYLEKIYWNGVSGNSIKFIASIRDDYGINPYSNNSVDNALKLDQIEIYDNNTLIKGYKFNYSYFNGIESDKRKLRLKLDSLCEYSVGSNLPPYVFRYNTDFNLPSKTSLCYDVWGYYNGTTPQPLSSNLFPEIVSVNGNRYFNWEYPPKQGNIVIPGRNVRCNPLILGTGMLNKIVYPTGGYAEFTFEPNSYLDMNGNEKLGGGVRIAKIKTDINERFFNYKCSNGKTSGKLLVNPMFSYSLNSQCFQQLIITSNSVVQLQGNTYGNIVGYSKVSESLIDNNNKTISTVDSFYNEQEIRMENLLYTYDETSKNGFLISKKLYNDYALVQENNYHTYLAMPDNIRANQIQLKYNDGIFYWCMVFPEYRYQLYGEEVIDHFNSGNVIQQISYEYNPLNHCVQKKSMSLNDKTYISQITYAVDINKSTYINMVQEHIVNEPIEITDFVLKDNELRVLRSNLILYNDIFFPYRLYSLKESCNSNNFIPYRMTSDEQTMDANYHESPDNEFYYENNGEIILPNEVVDKSGLRTIYLWGYEYQYLIAEIKNATYAEVSGALSGVTPDQLASSIIPDMNKVEALRTHQNLIKAQITTYTYKPLVGMTSQTDPRGVTTYYEYDSFNRLKRTYIKENNTEKTIQTYDYHYKQ